LSLKFPISIFQNSRQLKWRSEYYLKWIPKIKKLAKDSPQAITEKIIRKLNMSFKLL
jgi:hypothetical protein